MAGDNFLLVTQNIDNLHERAGSKRVLHMHGELLKVRCTQSGGVPNGPAISALTTVATAASSRRRCGHTWCGSARCRWVWTTFTGR